MVAKRDRFHFKIIEGAGFAWFIIQIILIPVVMVLGNTILVPAYSLYVGLNKFIAILGLRSSGLFDWFLYLIPNILLLVIIFKLTKATGRKHPMCAVLLIVDVIGYLFTAIYGIFFEKQIAHNLSAVLTNNLIYLWIIVIILLIMLIGMFGQRIKGNRRV
jgi:hypothetical protein